MNGYFVSAMLVWDLSRRKSSNGPQVSDIKQKKNIDFLRFRFCFGKLRQEFGAFFNKAAKG